MDSERGREIFDSLRSTLAFRVRNRVRAPKRFFFPRRARKVPIIVSGGVGDTILSFPLIKALRDKCGDVVVYSNHPGVYSLFMPDESHNLKSFPGYDYWITVNAIVEFTMTKRFSWFPPEVGAIYTNYIERRKEWYSMIRHHPYLDYELQRTAIARGLTRETLPFHLLGLEYKGPFTSPRIPLPERLKFLDGQKYVTVHNGFEASLKIPGRSTKNWHPELFSEFSQMMKGAGVRVVQIGARNGPSVGWVDYDFKDKLTMTESLAVLSGSLCHIDGDSGLVHAAAILGVPAVVLWGPTDHRYYGHEGHSHLTGPGCAGGCFWLTEDWMENCPLNYARPLCLDSITPYQVASEVFRIICKDQGNEIRQTEPQVQS